MNNSIYIRRKARLYLDKANHSLPDNYLLNLLKNIESLGYTFSPQLMEVVQTLSVEELKPFYHQLISDLKENRGAHVTFKPMYPNFPDQVKAASEQELYTNAFWHYLGDWIGQRILPNYQKKNRDPLKEAVYLKIIDLGSVDDFHSIFTKLVNSKTSLSETDKKDVRWFVQTYGEKVRPLMPPVIPQKENAAYLVSLFIVQNLPADDLLSKHIKTATDVLRLATALSHGDTSLAENTKFKTFSKINRRMILQALEDAGSITEDMLRDKNRWKRLGEKLHPFEYKNRFPKTCAAFDIIRNDKPFETFNGKVELSLAAKNIISATDLLKSRPGELARRLDHLLRTSEDSGYVVTAFREIAARISTPVLLQVHCHFKNRDTTPELRTFFPKGKVGKARAIDNNLPRIGPEISQQIVSICESALVEKFSQYKPLGKVYIDEKLKDYMVPFSQRSAAKALKTISRGSKMDLPAGNTVRFFIYWKQGTQRTDLDLSALGLDSDSICKSTIAYYNLKDIGGFHSGDITSAPDGASEFIDIDISRFLDSGMRYVLMAVNSFTKQPYCDLPICFAGFMIRKFPRSGEIYEPLTVENKFDLTANTKMVIPLIIDLLERKVIWTDVALKADPSTVNNVHNNMSSLTVINKAMINLVKPNLYDLFLLHVNARGQRTFDMQEATTIFAADIGITPSDIDIIVSEYL